MEATSRQEIKSEKWRKIVDGSRDYRGSLASYCKENSISYFQLNYWRRKLGKRKSPAVRSKSKETVLSAFVPVQIEDPVISAPAINSPRLPSALWTAEVLFNLVRLSQ
jgi:transposase-like protein